MSILRAENLTKRFGRRVVVGGVSLQIRSGEIIALLGRNGAGKTTTFLMMVGLIKPDAGTIYLDGQNISSKTTPQRASLGISYLPQESSVFLKATVEENLRLVLELQSSDHREKKDFARRLLDEFELSDLARQPAYSLSGGERRKLEICRALILKPKFFLLDEPFTGIDPLTVGELQKTLTGLSERGIGIVLSDHNVRDTFRIARRVYILDEGKMLVSGSPERVAADELARERFLGKDFEFPGGQLSLPLKNNGRPGFLRGNREKGKNKEEGG